LELAAVLKISMEHEATRKDVLMLLFLSSVQQQECVIISTGNQERAPTAFKFLFHPPHHKFLNLQTASRIEKNKRKIHRPTP